MNVAYLVMIESDINNDVDGKYFDLFSDSDAAQSFSNKIPLSIVKKFTIIDGKIDFSDYKFYEIKFDSNFELTKLEVIEASDFSGNVYTKMDEENYFLCQVMAPNVTIAIDMCKTNINDKYTNHDD